MPKSGPLALAVAGIALVVGVLACFLSWFDVSGIGFALPASYDEVVVFAEHGSKALLSHDALGALLYNSASTNPLVVIAFAVLLFFWPAMLVSGAIDLIGRTIRWHPALWGFIAFASAVLMMYKASGGIGLGIWTDLAAAILFLVASILALLQARRKSRPSTASAQQGQPGTVPGPGQELGSPM